VPKVPDRWLNDESCPRLDYLRQLCAERRPTWVGPLALLQHHVPLQTVGMAIAEIGFAAVLPAETQGDQRYSTQRPPSPQPRSVRMVERISRINAAFQAHRKMTNSTQSRTLPPIIGTVGSSPRVTGVAAVIEPSVGKRDPLVEIDKESSQSRENFRSITRSLICPAMQQVIDRLRMDGGGGVTEEHRWTSSTNSVSLSGCPSTARSSDRPTRIGTRFCSRTRMSLPDESTCGKGTWWRNVAPAGLRHHGTWLMSRPRPSPSGSWTFSDVRPCRKKGLEVVRSEGTAIAVASWPGSQ
jgi:hypothetical protein